MVETHLSVASDSFGGMSQAMPRIGSVGEAATPAPPAAVPPAVPAASSIPPAAAAIAPVAPAAAVPPAAAHVVAPPVAPPIGQLSTVHVNVPRTPFRTRDYVPPAERLPAPPAIPGKWVPEYTKDGKQYVVPGLDGIRQTETFTRATSLSKVLDDASALGDWKLRATVLGLMNDPELLDDVSAGGATHLSELRYSDRFALNSLAEQAARGVGAHDGRIFGTLLHGYLEAIVEGVITVDQAPPELQPYLAVLFAAVREHRLSFVSGMCERTVFIPATGMVGTLDFMVIDADGTLMIGDLKTSGSIDFSFVGIAVQLAQYANATMILSRDGTHWQQMPEVSKVMAKVASVPKDAANTFCRIYSIDLTLGRELMETAVRVNQLREAALRCASHPELRQHDDQLVAWADGAPVTAFTAGL